MRIKKRWIILPALLIAPFVASKLMFPTYTHRYRLTVNIEADGKLFSGSSVIEVGRNDHGPLEGLIHGQYDEEIIGESPLVDLGERGVVLAALRPAQYPEYNFKPPPKYAQELAYCAIYGPECEAASARSEFPGINRAALIQSKIGERYLDETAYPSLVWLPDTSDRNSAVPFLARDMRGLVGARIESIIVEMTSDRPRSGRLQSKLPWWDDYVAGSVAGTIPKVAKQPGPKEYQISASQFIAGFSGVRTQ